MVDNHPSADELRQSLVESLKRKGDLNDPTIEAAFLAIPRHVFLPDVLLERAYADEAIPIKRELDGTVISSASQPSMMALMLHQLRLNEGDNVLEIGAGTGYNAAIMQHIVGERGTITSVELDKELAAQARRNLQQIALGSVVSVVHADGALGYAPRAQYDRIIATAAIWDIPHTWVNQLKPDGILVAPFWVEAVQVSAAFTFLPDGSLYSGENIPCGFIPLRGLASAPNVNVRINHSGLILSSNDVDKIDGAALHVLLSNDFETALLGEALTANEYWHGWMPYLMLNVPEGHVFALYAVAENQQAYGLESYGFALIAPGSACFVPYSGHGECQCFGGADAFMTLDQCLADWTKAGRPGSESLRLRLFSKESSRKTDSSPTAPKPSVHGKIYSRRYHDVHVWQDVSA